MRIFFVIMALFLTFSAQAEEKAKDGEKTEKAFLEGWTVNVMAENDMFGSDTDRHYTHGTRLSFASPKGEVADWLKTAAGHIPLFNNDKNSVLRSSYAIGQNLYTPADISLTDPNEFDRPYAGWMYFSSGLVADNGSQIDNLEFTIGMVGPAALGEETQTFVHKVIDSPKPQGWDHQLKNELGLNVSYERKFRRVVDFDIGVYDLEFDASPHFGVSLGNVFTHGEIGSVFRIGHDLDKDRGGPPRIRPSLPGSDYYDTSDEFGWYFFGGLAGRYVAHNIFLDGNTFANSYSVDKNPFVGDFQFGIAMRFKDIRIAYTKIARTKEFKDQSLPDRFGAITLSYQF